MTREDIIRMAREVGLYSGTPRTPSTGRMIESRLERFAALIAAAEREACAKVAELVAREMDDTNGTATYIAKAIRARGSK
jgi:hypothetical protein